MSGRHDRQVGAEMDHYERECLDHIIVLNASRLRTVLKSYIA
jgi:hypothetical protein